MNVAARLAREVGDVIASGRRRGVHHVETKSSPTDLVTEWDTRAEIIIRANLERDRPGDGVIGEESDTTASTSGITWIVDPIDGTTNFTYGLSGYAVSIAAADASGPVAAAVHAPETRELFVAARGHGAWLNGKLLRCSDRDSLSLALIGTGFSYDPDVRQEQWSVLSTRAMDFRDIRRIGAASLDLCYVACGRLDAYLEKNLQPWDIAAGVLIAREAGAVVTDFSGSPMPPGIPSQPSEILASTPGIHSELVTLLTRPGTNVDQPADL